jgi:hypothetical protein
VHDLARTITLHLIVAVEVPDLFDACSKLSQKVLIFLEILSWGATG